MSVSVFELFSVGIGPSSSHTVGPMVAANRFVDELVDAGSLDAVAAVRVDLYGSLAATGRGHGTPGAMLLGLEGFRPDGIDTDTIGYRLAEIAAEESITLGAHVDAVHAPRITLSQDRFELHPETVLPFHPNAVTLTAQRADGSEICAQTYYSIGGGFVVSAAEADDDTVSTGGDKPAIPASLGFISAEQLLARCAERSCAISDVQAAIERLSADDDKVETKLLHLRDVMFECVRSGLSRSGELPGGLAVRRRAKAWYDKLSVEDPDRSAEFAEDWVNVVALAVNEENACGGRVVTAPTNGAAGIIPAVLYYALEYTDAGDADRDGTTVSFLLTAGAIGSLYKERASISGAEVGCQGEVGSAASMAAAGLAEVLGGSPAQVENAAEIAMEHSLGLTCDPISGLVQIPCIERNAIAAGTAINAARMALRGDGSHRVSLDEVIETMRATGADMSSKYKETATGGLAVNVPVSYINC